MDGWMDALKKDTGRCVFPPGGRMQNPLVKMENENAVPYPGVLGCPFYTDIDLCWWKCGKKIIPNSVFVTFIQKTSRKN